MRTIQKIMQVLSSVVMVAACTTSPKKEQIVLPATVESLFATCTTGDGALNVQVYEKDQLLGSGDLEWIAQFGRGWRSELINPVGRTLLGLTYTESAKTFTKSGAIASSVPPLSVRDDFVHVDGYFAGVMPGEVPCFLKFRLPRNWLAHVISFQRSAMGMRIGFKDDERTIETQIVGTQPELVRSICSTITWSAIFGMVNRNVIICNDISGARSGSLKGLNDFSIKWVDIDR